MSFGTFVLASLLALLLAVLAAFWYALAVPGRSHTGPLPELTAEEHELSRRLRRHVVAIASEPHNVAHPQALDAAADYIEQTLRQAGLAPQRQSYVVDRKEVSNIYVALPERSSTKPRRTLVVGAHYDSAGRVPGANDNGSGTAAVLELARLLGDLETRDTRLILVLFVNEEPPYFQTSDMGSARFAEFLKARDEPVAGMLTLETIGHFSNEPGSQHYPPPLSMLLPDRGDFLAFVGMPGSRGFLHDVLGTFRETTPFPTLGGIAPSTVMGIDWSDHWAFARMGIPALMVTDTAPFRYRHYHQLTDTPDKVDYESLARITKGFERVIRKLMGD